MPCRIVFDEPKGLEMWPNHPSFRFLTGVVGWCDSAEKIPMLGCPTYLDSSRARAYCACSGCGWGLFGHFYSRLSFLFSFSLSPGGGLIYTEIMSQRAVKPKTTNQANRFLTKVRCSSYFQLVCEHPHLWHCTCM